MKFKSFSTTALVAFLSLMVWVACTDHNDSLDSQQGRLTVRMTDAPFPYELVKEANVTVFKVEARRKKGEEAQDSLQEPESPFVTLMETEMDINLLELTNGLTETLVDAQVPAGTYDMVRIYVKGVNLVLNDGTVYDFKVPSGEQTGIKVFIKPALTVVGGLSADLLLDFDVSRSFVRKGNAHTNGGFVFKPVIKASNMSVAGTVAGKVFTQVTDSTGTSSHKPLEGVEVGIYAADTLNTTTFSNTDGLYKVMGLQAGSYRIKAIMEGYQETIVDTVAITAANKTLIDLEMVAEE